MSCKQLVEPFLAAFFSLPNRLTVAQIEQVPRLRVFAERIEELRSGNARWAVLPCWHSGRSVDYYALAFTEHEFRQLGLDLNAFVGCSFSTFLLKRSELDEGNATDNVLRTFGFEYVYKFSSDPNDDQASPRISQQLHRMHDVAMLREKRQVTRRAPLHILLRDYYMAIEAQSRSGAELALATIQRDGLLDAVNLLFLRTVLISRFGTLKELQDTGALVDLLAMRRPLPVTEGLVTLIYRSDLSFFESTGDVNGAIDKCRELQRLYPGLYQSWRGMRTADAAKSFLLMAATSSPPDIALRDAIVARVSDHGSADRSWIEAIAASFQLSSTGLHTGEVASAEASLQSALLGPATIEKVQILCRCAAFNDTLEIREAIRFHYAQLTPQQQEGLRVGKLASKLLDELLQSPTDNTSHPIPQNWYEWLTTLKTTAPLWTAGTELLRKHANEWVLTDGDSDPIEFTDLLFEVQERPELMLALPHLIGTARKDALWPRREWQGFYEMVMSVLASYTTGGIDDLIVWSEIVEVLLQFGATPEQYKQICTEADRLLTSYNSAATVDFATDLLDILLFYPCPLQQERLALFLGIANRAHGFRRLLETSQLAFLSVLASDFGQTEWTDAFALHDANAAQDNELYAGLNGTMLGIYGLTERVNRRAKVLFEALCEDIDVRINADHVATPALKNLAREADILVVNTGSAKHAATTFISANRRSDQVTLFLNAGGSQALLNLIEGYLRGSLDK